MAFYKTRPEEEKQKIYELVQGIKEKYLLAIEKNNNLLPYEEFVSYIEKLIKEPIYKTKTTYIINEINDTIKVEIDPFINKKELIKAEKEEKLKENTKSNNKQFSSSFTENPVKKEYSKSYAKLKDNGKTEYMALRIPKEYCDKLREDAKKQDRSVANIVKIILKNHYG